MQDTKETRTALHQLTVAWALFNCATTASQREDAESNIRFWERRIDELDEKEQKEKLA